MLGLSPYQLPGGAVVSRQDRGTSRPGVAWAVAIVVVGLASGVAAEDVDAILKRGTDMRRKGHDADALVEFQRAAPIEGSGRTGRRSRSPSKRSVSGSMPTLTSNGLQLRWHHLSPVDRQRPSFSVCLRPGGELVVSRGDHVPQERRDDGIHLSERMGRAHPPTVESSSKRPF